MSIVDTSRYDQNGVKELAEIIGKVNGLLAENNAEIDYERILYEQDCPGPRATVTSG